MLLQLKTPEGLAALTNKDDREDDHKDIYKEIFEKLVTEKFYKIKELIYEINHNYFKGGNTKKRFDNFNSGIKLFRKIKFSEMKLEEAKKTAEYI